MINKESRSNELRFVTFQEDDMWVAICLEHYIGAQSHTLEGAYLALKIAYRAEVDYSAQTNSVVFDGIMPAPDRFHKMWDSGPPVAQCGRIYDKYDGAMELAA